jgi:hypothetical protein
VFTGISIKLKQDARRVNAFKTLENLGFDYSFTFSNTNELHFRLQSPDFNQDDLSTFIDCAKTLTCRHNLGWTQGNVIDYMNFELITLTEEQIQLLRRHFPNVPIDWNKNKVPRTDFRSD